MSTSGTHDPGSAYPGPPHPGSAQPWSPYPVQGGPLPPAWPQDPTQLALFPPPVVEKPKPRWLPYVVIGVVCALVAAGFYVADRVSDPTFSTRAQRFVPDDGAVQYAVRTTPGDGRASSVIESARLTGVEFLTSLDFTFSTALLISGGFDLDRLTGVPFWRTTTTPVAGSSADAGQLVRAYQVDGPITLLGESGPGVARTYRPGLVELPADVRAGQSWSSAGSAGGKLTYRSEFRAESADAGCLQVRGSVAYADETGKAAGTTTVERFWCPAEGLTRETVTTGDQTSTSTSVRGLPNAPALTTAATPLAWPDPRTWQNRQLSSVSVDPNYGQDIMSGAPSGVPPVLTASGLLIRPNSSSDLVVFDKETPNQFAAVRRMRPGGTVLSLTAFGDVLVVTTGQREIVGYAASGVRLWQHDLDEVAYDAPVRVDDTRLALADSGGTVRVLDIASGRQRWQQDLRAEVKASPVADGRAVVVADGRGDLTAFAADDGAQLWRNELEVTGATLAGDTVVTYSGATLTAVAIQDGSTRFMEPFTGNVNALTAFDGRVVLATQLNTTIRSQDGVVQRVLDPYELVTTSGTHLVGWGLQQAEVLDRELRVVRTIDTPDRNLTTVGNWPVADRSGVYLFGGDWSAQSWDAP